MNKINCAERYIQNGWALTPVGCPEEGKKDSGKKPFLAEWQNKPIRDLEDAKKYWGNSNYNIGVLTGEPSRLIVLDIDYPEKFEAFLNKYPECRNTYIVRRNNEESGRCHYYFRMPDGMECPKSRRVATTDWGDLLSTGTQVVAPPSVHYTGGVYEVVNNVEPLPFKDEYLKDLIVEKECKIKSQKKVLVDSNATEKIDIDVIAQNDRIVFAGLPEKLISRIKSGASEGQRNTALFDLGRELRNHGLDKDKVEGAALIFCENCTPSYNPQDAIKTIDSVFNNNTPKSRELTLKKLNYYTKKVKSENGDEENDKYVDKPLDYHLVRDKLLTLTHDWIAKVYGNMFIVPKEKGSDIQWIEKRTGFFSALGCEYEGIPDWKKGAQYMSQDEAYLAILPELKKYEGVETAPHYPPLSDVFYNHNDLPEPNHSILNELLGFFTPETDNDRYLLIALFATALWGGLPGQRAPFLITSKDGRGVGKSVLAETAAEILGQTPIQVSTKDKAEDIKTRLLSSDAMMKRVVIFDNESGNSRISNDQVASLFTTGHISGKVLYKGEGSRANNMLWVITLNSPSLDSDFAVRCVPIALSRPQYKSNWKEDLTRFIRSNRETIQATLIDILKGEGCCSRPATRWGEWENNVLAKVPGINLPSVQNLILERQKQFDDEQFEIELIVDEIKNCISNNGFSLTEDKVIISNTDMTHIVRIATELKWSKTNILKMVRELIDKGEINELDAYRSASVRGFLWKGKDYVSGDMKMIKAIDR